MASSCSASRGEGTPLQEGERRLGRNQPCQPLIVDFSRKSCEMNVCYLSPHAMDFVMG